MNPEHSPLGKATAYTTDYDAALLFPIPRAGAREQIGIGAALPFFGTDIWNAYELSWLNARGKPQIAVATFYVPAESPNIVESKSFKLYLGSFAIGLGAFTFTMSALPGTPSTNNAIPMPYFGTTTFAAPGLGIIASIITVIVGLDTFGLMKSIAIALVFLGVYIVTRSKSKEQLKQLKGER